MATDHIPNTQNLLGHYRSSEVGACWRVSGETGMGCLRLGRSTALTGEELSRLHRPGCPPDPWTESCIKAGLSGRLWDKGHQCLSVGMAALWLSLPPRQGCGVRSPRAEGRDPRALQQPGKTTT